MARVVHVRTSNRGLIFKSLLAPVVAVLVCVAAATATAGPPGKLVGWGGLVFGGTSVPAGNDFVDVAVGSVFGLALRSDGSLAAWGSNAHGETSVPAGNDFLAIAAGNDHSLALKSDGSLVAWGRNFSGVTDVPAGNDFVAIAAGEYHSLALRSDGSLAAWGDNRGGQTNAPAGNDFTAIAGGWYHSLALKSDGSLAAWGYNSYGQINVPAGNDFVAVAAGQDYSLALKSDGSLAAWGTNFGGMTNVPAGNDFVAIAAGPSHGLALRADGSLAGWGSNLYGKANAPAGRGFVAISARGHNSLAIQAPEPGSCRVASALIGMALLRRRRGLFCVLVLAMIHYAPTSARAVTIDMVTVGNPGNVADARYNNVLVGSVDHVYRIGKYEVTAGQYTEFLNAVAKADPNALFRSAMSDPVGPLSLGANIQRVGSSPNYSYSVAGVWADRPVNWVSFWDAARFANWLHNGQPIGAQGPGTTEDGAYHDIGSQTLFGRNAGAKFFVPTEDEWYKAAYHDKTAGLAASYFDYATGKNALPGTDINETTNPGNNANYYVSDYVVGSPYYRTVPGEFELSNSPYGTFDQGGNIFEWNETAVSSLSRGLRGGSFYHASWALPASYRFLTANPTGEEKSAGFRVASVAVPEPITLPLLCFGSLAALWRRRGFVCTAILVAVVGIACTDLASANTFGSGANTFDIEFVTIGNPGNAADTTGNPNPAGSVSYIYNMGKYEVSRDMVTKASSVGGLGITLANMTSFGGNGVNRPATGVSWNEAARFVNWLNTNQGFSLAYKFATQPSDVGYSANQNISLWVLGDVGFNAANPFRNGQAHYFLPSVDEWNKAAYYDPISGLYYDYPTASDSVPTAVAAGAAAGTAVFGQPSTQGPADFTLAGGLSRYGTMGQGGSVVEWEETASELLNNTGFAERGIRGGSWGFGSLDMSSSNRFHDDPAIGGTNVGFRVASIAVPEPSSLLLCCGCLAALRRRRRFVCASILAAVVGIFCADRAEADTFGSGANAFNIEFVSIGNSGNAADTTGAPNPAGSVAFFYRMGKFEISEQMIDKANALGGLGLTKPTRGPDKPAGASWNEAARFINWLNTSTGSVPAYKFALQPGDVGYIANVNIEVWTIGDAGYTPSNLYRNSRARYFLPSVDEWYKAAYYDPSANGGAGGYWDYPTGSDTAPTPVASGTAAGTAVFDQILSPAVPADVTQAGGLSPYGTMGQGGNVHEWEETDFDLLNGPGSVTPLSGTSRGFRGGMWSSGVGLGVSTLLSSSVRQGGVPPAAESSSGSQGFRVASVAVPEPRALLLFGCAAGAALVLRRRSGQARWLLVATMIGAVALTPNAATAVSTTFKFATSIDTTVVGGRPAAPLTVTYTFDSELANGTGPFLPNSNLGSYGPLTMQIQIADQIVSATGGGISVFNDVTFPQDEYDVRPGSGPASFTGQLFGRDIAFFRFVLSDVDAVMFDSIALPLTPGFASGADFQQVSLDLFDDEFGQIMLGLTEFADTPAEQRTPFSLTLVPIPEPSALLLVASGVGVFALRRRRKIKDACFDCRALTTVLATALSVVLLQAPAAHAATVRTVALSGQQAPGTPDGVRYELVNFTLDISSSPVLNDAGQTAFVGRLIGAGVDDTNNYGIWSEGSGSLALVARTGSQAPGTASGMNFVNGFGPPVLNDAGQIAFVANFTDGVTGGNGVWSQGSGTLALVARSGSQPPGTPRGVNYVSFSASRLVLNDAGQTAFSAELRGSGVDSSNNGGIWSEGSGNLELVARGGSQAPGTPSGVNFSGLSAQSPVVLNNAGQTAFVASLTGSGVDSTNSAGIWSEGSGSLTLVARRGGQAAGVASGVNYAGFAPPVLNDAGQIAFRAPLTGSGVNLLTNNYGIWSEGSGSLALVARAGDHAPGTPSGVNYRGVNVFGTPVINNAGQTAFVALLSGSGVDVTNNEGIWSNGSGSLALVARRGSHAPGTPNGVNFGIGSNQFIPVINDAGQTAFLAGLSGSGVDSTNNFGLWATDRNNALQLIVRMGDLLEVAPGDFRTINGLDFVSVGTGGTGNSDGRPSPFNNLGQLAFGAFFTDGSTGIFVSNRVAVPEPSTHIVVAGSLVSLMLAGRRRHAWPASVKRDIPVNS